MAAAVVEKTCADCRLVKAAENFGPSKQTKDGLASYCYDCRRRQSHGYYKRWTPEQREKHRSRVLQWRYGIDLDALIALYEEQDGRCAICRKPGLQPVTGEKRKSSRGVLRVDHDHSTGAVRGLLCTTCNTALGGMQDDPALLEAAAVYLRERGGQ